MGTLINVDMLRSLREVRGWDQTTLAARAGIDRSIISRLERGIQQDLKVSILVALANALESTVDALVVRPATAADAQAQLVAELAAAVDALTPLSPAHQQHVAAILRGYLSAIPD
jgi:transcriptional regulator with XRE-family HTH domain